MSYLSWKTAETLKNAGFLLFGKQGKPLHTQEVTGSSPAVSTKSTGNSDEFPVLLFVFSLFYDFDIFPHYPFSPDHRDAADRKTPAFAGVLFLPSCCACCFPEVKAAQQRANFTSTQGSCFSLFCSTINVETNISRGRCAASSVPKRCFGTKDPWTTRQKRRDGT